MQVSEKSESTTTAPSCYVLMEWHDMENRQIPAAKYFTSVEEGEYSEMPVERSTGAPII